MLATNWGYSIDVDKIPPLLTVNEFDSMGGSSMSSSYEAKQATLNGVSQAIRDYCGWHVAPKLTCKAVVPDSAHVILPSMGVTELTATVPTVEPRHANSYGVIDMRRQALLEVTYVAGFDMVDALLLLQVFVKNTQDRWAQLTIRPIMAYLVASVCLPRIRLCSHRTSL